MDVQFIKNHEPYFVGEVATFPDYEARQLVAAGWAVPAAKPEAPSPVRGKRAAAKADEPESEATNG